VARLTEELNRFQKERASDTNALLRDLALVQVGGGQGGVGGLGGEQGAGVRGWSEGPTRCCGTWRWCRWVARGGQGGRAGGRAGTLAREGDGRRDDHGEGAANLTARPRPPLPCQASLAAEGAKGWSSLLSELQAIQGGAGAGAS
jgi:hypothetical protein